VSMTGINLDSGNLFLAKMSGLVNDKRRLKEFYSQKYN